MRRLELDEIAVGTKDVLQAHIGDSLKQGPSLHYGATSFGNPPSPVCPSADRQSARIAGTGSSLSRAIASAAANARWNWPLSRSASIAMNRASSVTIPSKP